MEEELLPLRERMNLQTARISWPELARHFAAGRVILVDNQLDLVEVVTYFVEDNATCLKHWLANKQIQLLPDATAKQWVTVLPEQLWAVVAAPWVLVQNRTTNPSD